MITEGRVGLISGAAGTINPMRQNNEGAQVVVNGGGKYYEDAKNGRMFVIANQAAVALTAAMATTYTGLCLSNPVGSAVNVVLNRFGFSLTVVASAATVIGLMTGVTPTAAIAASLTPRNRLVGGPGAVARATAGCDFTGGVPVLEQVLSQVGTLATSGSQIGNAAEFDLDGSLILQPGGYVAIYSFAAFTAALIGSFMWTEVPR